MYLSTMVGAAHADSVELSSTLLKVAEYEASQHTVVLHDR